MSEPNWKRAERDVADFFQTARTPLSGGSSRHTRSDTLSGPLFVEAKYRKRHTAVALWDEISVLAAREHKTPVVCLKERNRPGFWLVIRSSDLRDVFYASSASIADPSSHSSKRPAPSETGAS